MTNNIYIKVDTQDINYVNRIMEGYEHLGIVSTFNRAEGILIIRATSDTYDDVVKILSTIPKQVVFIDYNERLNSWSPKACLL